MLELSGSVLFQFPLIVSVGTSSHCCCTGSGRLFREVLLSVWLKDYEMEILLTDEQSVSPPWHIPVPVPPPELSAVCRATAGDEPHCRTGPGHCTASCAMNCRFVHPLKLLGGGSAAVFKGLWSFMIMICQIQFLIVMMWLKCGVI